jgi:hypothetical protein
VDQGNSRHLSGSGNPAASFERRRGTATLFAIAIVVPFCAGLVILQHLGFAPPIYIQWGRGTALYMIVAAFLLRNKNP